VVIVAANEVGQGILATGAELGIGCLRGLEQDIVAAVCIQLINCLDGTGFIILAIQVCTANVDDALAPDLLRSIHLGFCDWTR